MRRLQVILPAVVVVLVATGCAEPNLAEDNAQFCGRELSGFFLGLWHGFIAPVSFIGSLFDAKIAVYDICNVGGWYDFGFCLGVGAFTSGSHSAAYRAPWPGDDSGAARGGE